MAINVWGTVPNNLLRDDFISDNWGGFVGWDSTSTSLVSLRVQKLKELSPSGKPAIRITSEALFDNTGRDGTNFKCEGKLALVNGQPCEFSAYVRAKNLPKGGLILHDVPWYSEVRTALPQDTTGQWVRVSWKGKINYPKYDGYAQLSFYFGSALGKGAYLDIAEPYLSGVLDEKLPSFDHHAAKARPGRIVPVDPILDDLAAENAKMLFYYPGDRKNSEERLDLRATAQDKVVTLPLDVNHRALAEFGQLAPTQFMMKVELVGRTTGKTYLTNAYRARARAKIANPTPLKRLNNYVCEIFSEPLKNGSRSFTLAKETWVYFGFSKPLPAASVSVDGEKRVVRYREYEPQEGMRFLQPGTHTIEVEGAPEANDVVFSVRTVKSIHRSGLHLSMLKDPNFDGYHYGEDFWRRLGLFSGFNRTGCSAKRFRQKLMQPILAEMRERGVEVEFGYGTGSADQRRRDLAAYMDLATNSLPYQLGHAMNFDENAIRSNVGKVCKINTSEIWWHAYDTGHHINLCFDDLAVAMHVSPTYDTAELSAYVNQGDGRGLMLGEAYFYAVENQAGVNNLIDFLRAQKRQMSKIMPASVSRYSFLLCGWMMSGAWSPWWNTDMDMRAFISEVCHQLATDPEFVDNGGFTFSTPACWEDHWRCISDGLVRHYCIEGRTDDFAKLHGLKLFPNHLQNGDFLDGLNHWKVEEAESGSIKTASLKNYGNRWQGRQYPPGYQSKRNQLKQPVAGDWFVSMTRSEKRPNVIRQQLVGLEPGRVYQAVYTAADRETVEGGLSIPNWGKHKIANAIVLTAKVNGADVIDDLCHSTTNFGKYGIGLSRTARVVFRATKPTAELEFSDWQGAETPGLPSGTGTLLNYIMVHPYYYRDEAELETLKDLYHQIHEQTTAMQSATDFVLAERGKGGAEIVIRSPRENLPAMEYAAKELQHFVAEQTGAKLAIKADPKAQTPGRETVVLQVTDQGNHDWYNVKVQGKELLVTGNERGVLYGVYDILKRYGECDWLSSTTSVIPKRDRIVVPKKTDFTEWAAFSCRDTSWYEATTDPKFSLRRRLNGRSATRGLRAKHIPFKSWYNPDNVYGMSHTMYRLCPARLYAKEHPEYFAIHKGERRITGDEKVRVAHCFSNPGLQETVISNFMAHVREYPGVDIFALNATDNNFYCQCPQCTEIDAREGGHAGAYIMLVNRVARELAKEFPKKRVMIAAYLLTRVPPKHLQLEPNVVVDLANIECDFSQPMLTGTYPQNRAFVNDLMDWRRISGKSDFQIWNYSVNFAHYPDIYPNVAAFCEDMKLYRDRGVTMMMQQGAGQRPHGWFADLKVYVISEMEWDPDQPLEPIVNRFFRRFYGAAAPYARKYYDEAISYPVAVTNYARKSYLPWNAPLSAWRIPADFFERGDQLWQQAAAAVKNDPVRSRNVFWGRFWNDYSRAMGFGTMKAGPFLSRNVNSVNPKQVEKIKESAQRVLDNSSADFLPDHAWLAEGRSTHMNNENVLHEVMRYVAPTAACDRVVIEDTTTHNQYHLEDDPLAGDGNAQYRDGVSFSWGYGTRINNLQVDPGVKYQVRIRARVEKIPGREGEAIWAGIYDYARDRASVKTLSVKTSEAKTDGYVWYELEPWIPTDGDRLWFAPGRYNKNKETQVVKAVWFDCVEIVRVDK